MVVVVAVVIVIIIFVIVVVVGAVTVVITIITVVVDVVIVVLVIVVVIVIFLGRDYRLIVMISAILIFTLMRHYGLCTFLFVARAIFELPLSLLLDPQD